MAVIELGCVTRPVRAWQVPLPAPTPYLVPQLSSARTSLRLQHLHPGVSRLLMADNTSGIDCCPIGAGVGGEMTTDNYLDNSPGTEHSAQVAHTIISGVDFANVCG